MNTLAPAAADELDCYLDSVEHLPPAPILMTKLIALFRQPDRDIDDVVELMRQDPSLTAEVLRNCSNSFFTDDAPVVDVAEAVFRLGFYEVYRLTISLFGKQSMKIGRGQKNLPVEELWQHCAVTAAAAGVLAREVGECEGTAFTAGLLHDVGKIVLASHEGERYTELARRVGRVGDTASAAERAEFGFSHAEIGGRLLTRWGVPAEISDPVIRHHDAAWSPGDDRLAAIVSLANLMAHCVTKRSECRSCELTEGVQAMESLGLNLEDMTTLSPVLRNDLKRLNTLVTMPT